MFHNHIIKSRHYLQSETQKLIKERRRHQEQTYLCAMKVCKGCLVSDSDKHVTLI